MAAAYPDSCECCDHHTKCCSCKFKNLNGWTKSLKDFKLSPAVWADWLAGDQSAGGRTNSVKAYNFF